MQRATRRKRKIGEVPIDDTGQPISRPPAVPTELEIAAMKERDAHLARQVGMPPVGSTATSRSGIVWKVDGHTHASCLTTQGQENSELTLYPVVFPQNLSPKLNEFLSELARCTPKAIMPLDTLPHQFPKRAHPGGHFVDAISDPYRILLFLDGSDASEAIIAHELAHVWIELVRGIEDYRVMRDTSDSGRYSQVQFLQSFVLDVAVDTLLQEKGFDTSDITADKLAALRQMGDAAKRGYQPPTKREAVYMASFLASSMLEKSESNLLCTQTSALVESNLPDVFRLANVFRDAVRDHPPTCAESLRLAIDQVLTAAFDYTDGGIDLASELFELKPEPCWDHDKFRDWLPGLSVRGKCEVGIAMARSGVKPEDSLLFQRQEDGRITLRFRTPDGGLTPYIELEHVDMIPETPEARDRRIMEINQMNRVGPGTPSPHVGRSLDAEVQRVMEINEMNRKRLDQMGPQGPKGPQTPGMPQIPGPPLPPGFPPMTGRSYSPGLARFLTQVRLQELLESENPYGYAYCNPMTYSDPSGLAPGRPPGPIQCNNEWKQYISEFCWQCRRSGFETRCMKECDALVKAYLRRCRNSGPSSSCEWIAQHWSERFDNHGNVNELWRQYCAECCAELYQDNPVGNCPTLMTDVLTNCVNGCFDGQLTGGSGFSAVGALRPSAISWVRE